MKKIIAAAAATVAGAAVTVATLNPGHTTPLDTTAENIYAFKLKNIDGKDTGLDKYKGKVLLVVNVASKCGLTPQYEGLEALYKKYKDKGLVVMGFPANEFGGQEPGSNEEIKKFCTGKYDVTFPMFSKIVVKGEETHPLYKWLLSQTPQHQDIEWNFAKFLVGRDGKVIQRFHPKTTPEDKDLVASLEKALASK
ncbi:MAG: glutathione peroxidase [Armatimonadetes bacterium]|nr:glutathione peroxidase [Armatimonadota bacterium]